MHRKRKLTPAQEAALVEHVRLHPGLTLEKTRAWLLSEHGVSLSIGAMWQTMQRLKMSFKKALRETEQDWPDVAKQRRAWKAAHPFINPHSLIFLGETGASTKMARLYGWAPVGQRCRDNTPFRHWKTLAFIAGLRLSGLTVPWVLDGPMGGDGFRIYSRDVLAPTLKPGDVVVIDNLPSHKVSGILEVTCYREFGPF